MNKVLIVIICVMVVNWFWMAVYCRVERKIDNKKLLRVHSYNSEDKTAKESTIKQVYHWLNAYLYGWVRYNILLAGHIPSYRIRKLFYWAVFAMKIKRGTVIFGGCEFRSPWNITLGNCTIGSNSILDGRGRIIVEDDVVFGSGVHIWTMQHSINDPYFKTLEENIRPVIVHRHAWVASDSMIQPGVAIGEGVVLASKACAVKDCEPFGVYAGIPAIRIAERSRDLRYKLDGKVSWHFM